MHKLISTFLATIFSIKATLVFSVPSQTTTTLISTPKITTYAPMPKPPADAEPWGKLKQVAEHTYKIRVANDPTMGTPLEILEAINNLRARNGAQRLISEKKICDYTQSRADFFNKSGKIDAHAGFKKFLDSEDGFVKLGFGQIGENSSYGYRLSAVHLIEFVYMASPTHNKNQLDPKWDRGCVGVSGLATNIIFATSPL